MECFCVVRKGIKEDPRTDFDMDMIDVEWGRNVSVRGVCVHVFVCICVSTVRDVKVKIFK